MAAQRGYATRGEIAVENHRHRKFQLHLQECFALDVYWSISEQANAGSDAARLLLADFDRLEAESLSQNRT